MTSARCEQAVILAAGRGSRMGALTDDIPKCLCPLAGRRIIDWTLDALRVNGIREVTIVAGWKHERLVDVADRIIVNPKWASVNMVRSLQLAEDVLARAPTLIVYGDGAYGAPSISVAIDDDDHDITVPVDVRWLELWRRRFSDPLDDAETLTRERNRITSIGRRAASLSAIEGQFMGLLRLNPGGWTRISAWLDRAERIRGRNVIDRLDMTGLLQGMIESGEDVHSVDIDGGWVEIDSATDVEIIERCIDEPAFRHDFR